MRVFFSRGLLVVVIAAISICLYKMITIRNTYVHEEQVHNVVLSYAPPVGQFGFETYIMETNEIAEPEVTESADGNEALIDAQRDINEDIFAWIRIPNTYIDYPVVQCGDNSFYINHDVLKQNAAAGALFMDSRNSYGFIDFNSIIYGHNMKNGSMFGELVNFHNKAFFLGNPDGRLYLVDSTYALEVFAFLRIKQDDRYIYGSVSGGNFDEFIEYVGTHAINYKDIGLTGDDRIVTLSTCANDYADSRMAVLARLNRVSQRLEFR